jgi:hypothetical protein
MSTATINMPAAAAGSEVTPKAVVALKRRTIDTVLIAFGALATVVLAVGGGLLTWGHNFSADYVKRELGSQNVAFPAKEDLVKGGREDLVKWAGHKVDTGDEAEAYASFINGHLQGIANGATYADLGTPERVAAADVQAAKDAGKPQATIDELAAKKAGITAQRETLFKGETLRGLLLSAFAWSTVGTIAGIAAIVAFAAAAVMALLVVLGFIHHARTPRPA